MSKRVTGLNDGLSYLGVEALTPPDFVVHGRTPTRADSLNFNLGTFWLATSGTLSLWVLVSLSEQNIAGPALWVQLYPGASLALGPGVVQVDNANVFFSDYGIDGEILISSSTGLPLWRTITAGAGITVVNGANSITISAAGGGGLATFHTDAGDATVAGAAITVAGGDNINTSGAGATVTVNLDTSILQPSTNITGSEGIYALGPTNYVTDRFMHNYGLDNTFLGYQAGNLTLGIAASNVGIGTDSLKALFDGSNNTAVGYQAGIAVTDGSGNTLIGRLSGNLITTGDNNIGLGPTSLDNLVTGSGNIGIGLGAGLAYTGAESYNILIGNDGVLGESNVIRIGTEGSLTYQQNKIFAAGIYLNTTLSGTKGVVFCDQYGQLGTGAAPSDKQVLTGNTGGSPNWYTLTSTGGTVTITQDNGLGTINFEAAGVAALTALQDDYGMVATPTGGIITMSDLANLSVNAAVHSVYFKLNDSILQPPTNVTGTQGVYALGSTFPFDYITDRFLHNYGTRNTFLGYQAGRINAGLTGTDNVAVGQNAADALTSGSFNVAISTNALGAATSAANNIAIGVAALSSATTTSRNIGIGVSALGTIQSGTGVLLSNDNVAIGYQALQSANTANRTIAIGNGAGANLTTAASDNILIGYNALGASTTISHRLQIGATGTGNGQQSSAYIGGIYGGSTGVAATVVPQVVFAENTDKIMTIPGNSDQILMGGSYARWRTLGSSGGSINITYPTASTINFDLNSSAYLAFFAYIPVNIANVTGDGSTYYFGRNAAMVESYDTGADFFPGTGGTGVGSEAVFTAPKTGVYYFTMSVLATNLVTPPAVAPVDPISIVTTARTYSLINCIFTNQGTQSYGFSAQANMTAGDTAKFTWSLYWGDGTKTRGIGATHSWCAGFLVPA